MLGIKTIGDLTAYPKEILDKKLGKMGGHFYHLAHGIDERPVHSENEVKSVSNERTFWTDILDERQMLRTWLQLSEKVGFRIRKKSLSGKTIHLKLRYDNFSTITRNKTLPDYINDTDTIFSTIKSLFEYNYQKGRKVRLLGVGISSFGDKEGRQLSLFGKSLGKKKALDEIQDLITNKFGKGVISRGESISNKDLDNEKE